MSNPPSLPFGISLASPSTLSATVDAQGTRASEELRAFGKRSNASGGSRGMELTARGRRVLFGRVP